MPAAKQISNATLATLFFFSGALALVYEALWQRRFALVFGSAAPATAAVLAAYFAGLALGSFVIGNRVHRFKSPLKLYAILEVGIAIGALMVEPLLNIFDKAFPSNLLLKTIVAFLTLAIPTMCMGGTFPALGAFIDRGEHHLGRTAGLLYATNTAGAALGVLAVPLLLLPLLGARNTLYATAALNLLLAAIAYQLSRPQAAPVAASKTNLPKTALALSFFSGAIAFIVQILWNRAFAQIHENSLYTFALIVSIFIAALAFGAQITRFFLRRKTKPDTLLAAAWISAGIMLMASPFEFLSLTNNLSYVSVTAKLTGLALITIFPTATLLGIALPAIFERAGANTTDAGKTLGRLLTANLIGSTFGALIAAFVFPQWFGLWGSMCAAGLLLFAASIPFSRKIAIACLLLLPISFWLVTKNNLPRLRINPNEKLLHLTEGPHGIVAVTERANSRRLKLNNSYVLGGTAATGDERMQSHIPLLLHPDPKRVAYLGLGTAISAGAATLHPIQQTTLLELVPEVAQAARTHFAEANLRVLDHPNSRLIIEDARNYLRRTNEKFDVIIGDLVVPWRAGEGALFTQENFRASKNALAPGGLFCQWLPLFQLSEDEFRIVLNTFLSVFPEACLWRADFSPNETALALIAFADNTTLNAETVRRRLSQMTRDPANPQLTDDFALWMNFIGAIYATEVNPTWRINSEDRPWVELAGSPGRSAFTGRAFQKWSNELNAVSIHRFNATEREAAAIQAGSLLFEFTLNLSENNRPAAARAQAELQQLLPPSIASVLFPKPR